VKLSHGNIWDFLPKGYYITIPTNVGWTVSTPEPVNPMGRGLAKDARDRFPGCDRWLGKQYCLTSAFSLRPEDPAWLKIYPSAPLIFFPTKPLNALEPWRSWSTKSNKTMISKLLDHFPKFVTEFNLGKVAIPLLGAGNGGLDPAEMKALIQQKLGSDNRFLLITPAEL
jgi:hypothetical protein